MRFGNNKWFLNTIRFFLLFLICVIGAGSAACQTKPKDAVSILSPCQKLIDEDDIQAAGKCYERAIAANPQQVNAIEEIFTKSFFEKCLNFKEKENYEKAIVCLEGLSVVRPDSANIRFQLARSYYEYNKTKRNDDFDLLERAEEAIKAAVKIKPEDAATHYVYGRILERKGDWREAATKHIEAVRLEPKNSFYRLELATAQEKVGDLSAALANYFQVLTLDPKNTLALYYSAKLYEKTGNKDQAIKNYEKLLEIKGEYEDARERLEKLKEKKTEPKQKPGIRGKANDGTHTLPQ